MPDISAHVEYSGAFSGAGLGEVLLCRLVLFCGFFVFCFFWIRDKESSFLLLLIMLNEVSSCSVERHAIFLPIRHENNEWPPFLCLTHVCLRRS